MRPRTGGDAAEIARLITIVLRVAFIIFLNYEHWLSLGPLDVRN